MVLFIRCNDIQPDPRLQKYIDFLESIYCEYKILAWDRLGKNLCDTDKIIYFKKKCKFGGGIKNIGAKFQWMVFIIKNLVKYRKKYQIIHACDIDAALPAVCFKLLRKRIIYDVFDWIGDESSSSLIGKVILLLQQFVVKEADYVIICEEYRRRQIGAKATNVIIMPNIPELVIAQSNASAIIEDTRLTIGYVGVFDENRGLEQLLDIVARNSQFNLRIAGFGALHQLVEDYGKRWDNIEFLGSVPHKEGLQLLGKCDIIAAFYFVDGCQAHRYAAPNKFYEALMLGIPVITNDDTFFGERVRNEAVGLVTKANEMSIEHTLHTAANNKKDLEDMGQHARTIWNRQYSWVISEFMNHTYLKILQERNK